MLTAIQLFAMVTSKVTIANLSNFTKFGKLGKLPY